MRNIPLSANRLWCLKTLMAFWILNAIPGAVITYVSLVFVFLSLKDMFINGTLNLSGLAPFVLWLLYAIFAIFVFIQWILAIQRKSFMPWFHGILSVVLWLTPVSLCAAHGIFSSDSIYDDNTIHRLDSALITWLALAWFLVPLGISLFMVFVRKREEPSVLPVH